MKALRRAAARAVSKIRKAWKIARGWRFGLAANVAAAVKTGVERNYHDMLMAIVIAGLIVLVIGWRYFYEEQRKRTLEALDGWARANQQSAQALRLMRRYRAQAMFGHRSQS